MGGSDHKSFDAPDEVREFPLGRSEIVNIGGGEVGRMTLEPGWSWSEHIKPVAGTELCEAHHFQYGSPVGSGCGCGRLGAEVGEGEVSWLEPGHDAWVIGDEPVVAVDWGGAPSGVARRTRDRGGRSVPAREQPCERGDVLVARPAAAAEQA